MNKNLIKLEEYNKYINYRKKKLLYHIIININNKLIKNYIIYYKLKYFYIWKKKIEEINYIERIENEIIKSKEYRRKYYNKLILNSSSTLPNTPSSITPSSSILSSNTSSKTTTSSISTSSPTSSPSSSPSSIPPSSTSKYPTSSSSSLSNNLIPPSSSHITTSTIDSTIPSSPQKSLNQNKNHNQNVLLEKKKLLNDKKTILRSSYAQYNGERNVNLIHRGNKNEEYKKEIENERKKKKEIEEREREKERERDREFEKLKQKELEEEKERERQKELERERELERILEEKEKEEDERLRKILFSNEIIKKNSCYSINLLILEELYENWFQLIEGKKLIGDEIIIKNSSKSKLTIVTPTSPLSLSPSDSAVLSVFSSALSSTPSSPKPATFPRLYFPESLIDNPPTSSSVNSPTSSLTYPFFSLISTPTSPFSPISPLSSPRTSNSTLLVASFDSKIPSSSSSISHSTSNPTSNPNSKAITKTTSKTTSKTTFKAAPKGISQSSSQSTSQSKSKSILNSTSNFTSNSASKSTSKSSQVTPQTVYIKKNKLEFNIENIIYKNLKKLISLLIKYHNKIIDNKILLRGKKYYYDKWKNFSNLKKLLDNKLPLALKVLLSLSSVRFQYHILFNIFLLNIFIIFFFSFRKLYGAYFAIIVNLNDYYFV